MTEQLILVNSRNRAVGQGEKNAVHAKGQLHRAFSVFLVNRAGQILLQQRAYSKYHSAGLWANSCCGHPRPGELTRSAAERRLGEELGTTTRLQFGFRAHYLAKFDNGLSENEIVYVYFGVAPEEMALNPAEVAAVEWRSFADLKQDAGQQPERYVFWLNHYLTRHEKEIKLGLAESAKRARG
jgi:isopentenyl-diphosphate delta-isomerase